MSRDEYTLFPCELCGGHDFADVPVAPLYMNGQSLQVCKGCGFVQVTHRRSPERIAEVWSKELFGGGYTARWPAVKARQTYVADMTDQALGGLRGKLLCDIGAGEGEFLKIARGPDYGAQVFGIEPSRANCDLLDKASIENFCGTIEEYIASGADRRFDVVTIMWTLENCNSCIGMLDAAWQVLKEGGHLVVATGSRLLVPFKKPLGLYLSHNPADTHSFRFSANALQGLLAKTGFEKAAVNRYLDTDWLVMIGRKTDRSQEIPWKGDDWQRVIEFFNRWHEDTKFYEAELAEQG